MGGTFDPVHAGHLHAARSARNALDATAVTLLLAARPWHRPTSASVAHRWRMLCLAAQDDPGLVPSNVEVRRSGPSYTVDTLAGLADEAPVTWLIGRDALDDIGSWHRVEKLHKLCHLLVLDRPGADGVKAPLVPHGFEWVDDPRELATENNGGIACLPDAMLDISASQVRRMIRQNNDASALLTQEVWSYIRAHGLYASSTADGG